ncbi:MAG: acyltransferase, partial [Proteobacteria bacterium]|nr:acyltransferase [Pseudomonadota bacterium]
FWGETRIFKSGNTPFKVFDIGPARVGMMICFDWLFPEAARTLALLGADIIAHPSNLVLPNCPQAMITRCLENRVWAITANRVGGEERIKGNPLKFIGSSQVVGPDGTVVVRSGRRVESQSVDIDVQSARNKMINRDNDIIGARRTGLYKL